MLYIIAHSLWHSTVMKILVWLARNPPAALLKPPPPTPTLPMSCFIIFGALLLFFLLLLLLFPSCFTSTSRLPPFNSTLPTDVRALP